MAASPSSKAPERFIRRLKQAMADSGLSLNEIARRADLSPAYLSFLINGKRNAPSNTAIARLEEVLNLSQGELNQAAAKPDEVALEFFRKNEAASIVRTLAPLPNKRLAEVRQLIEKYLKQSG